MANDGIQELLVTQFSAKIHAEAQQVKARTKRIVKIVPMNAEKMAYDGLGTVEANEIVGRNQPIQFSSIEHKRRKIVSRRFAVTLPLDATDAERALVDQKGEYAKACVMGLERKFDRVTIETAFATVYTGQEFATAVTAANDGVLTVDATSGLTFDKIAEIKQKFANNEVGTEIPENIYLLFSGDEQTDIIKETKFTSSEYTKQTVVDKGKVTEVMGIETILFGASVKNPILPLNASSKRRCVAMSDRAIQVGMQREVSVKIQPRNELYNTEQIVVTGVWGAVRTEGVLVMEVTTTPKV